MLENYLSSEFVSGVFGKLQLQWLLLTLIFFRHAQMKLVIARQLKKFRQIGTLSATYTCMTIGNFRQCLICLHNQHWTGVFQLSSPLCGWRWHALVSCVRPVLFLSVYDTSRSPGEFHVQLKMLLWMQTFFVCHRFSNTAEQTVVHIHIILWLGLRSVFSSTALLLCRWSCGSVYFHTFVDLLIDNWKAMCRQDAFVCDHVSAFKKDLYLHFAHLALKRLTTGIDVFEKLLRRAGRLLEFSVFLGV